MEPDDDGRARERMLAALPLAERRIDLAGVGTAVLEGGDGPPLILLQGGIECGGAYWAPVVAGLAARHRVVIPDLPGLGRSDPLARLDPASFGGWLSALIRESCSERPALVAHSLGGSLAARFATRHGDLLRGLVVYGAPGIGPYRMPLRLRVTAVRFGLRPTERNAERLQRLALLDLDAARRRDPEWFAAFGVLLRRRAALPHVKRTTRQLVEAGVERIPDDALRRIGVPVALVWGSRDRFVPLALAEAAAARLDWPLEVVGAAGHAAHMEQPDAFLRAFGAIRG